MKLRLCPALLLGLLTLNASPTRADEPELPPLTAATYRPHWEISLAAQLAYGIQGRRCVREASDLIACSALALVAFEFAPRYRFERVSLGAVAQLGKGDAFSLLRLGAEARYHPLDAIDVDPWLGADAGAAVLTDTLRANELGRAESFVTAAPALGVSLGIDFAIGETVSLGICTRLLWLALGDDDRFDRKPSYDHQLLFSGGIAGTYRFEP